MRVDGYVPNARESIPANAIALDARASDAPCRGGTLRTNVAEPLIPTAIPRPPLGRFLRDFERMLDVSRQVSFAVGPLDECPLSNRSPIEELPLSQIVLLTPPDNQTVLNLYAPSLSFDPKEQTGGLLAEDTLYALVSFNVSALTDAERDEIANVSGEKRVIPSDYFCVLTDNEPAANAALAEISVPFDIDDATGSSDGSTGDSDDSDTSESEKEGTSLSVGEAISITGGTIVALLTVITIVYLTVKRSQHRNANALPQMLILLT